MLYTYKRLGELLVARSAISALQLSVALADQKISGRRLGEIMVDRGYTTEEEVAACLAYQYGYPVIDVLNASPTADALAKLSADEAMSLRALAIEETEDGLLCAISDPIDVNCIESLERLAHRRLVLQVAPERVLLNKIRASYGLAEADLTVLTGTDLGPPKRFTDFVLTMRSGKASFLSAWDALFERKVSLIAYPENDPDCEFHFSMICGASRGPVDGLAPIYDSISHEGYRWTVTKRIDGESLQSVLVSRGPRSWAQTAALVSRIAEIVDHIQRQGGSGTWICPANVLMRASGPLLVPFAVPPKEYRAAEGETPGPASAFALGCLLQDCLCSGSTAGFAKDVIERCSADRPDRFHAAIEVACALRTQESIEAVVDGPQREGDGPLNESMVSTTKSTIWSKLLGKTA